MEITVAHVCSLRLRRWTIWRLEPNKVCFFSRGVIHPSLDFKNHNDLPLARIKRIMKSDEDVRMISAEAPVLFAKACEMFILELTLRCVGPSPLSTLMHCS
jgi:hypothetical protein